MTAPQSCQLRKHKPHPMRPLLAPGQFLNHAVVNRFLGFQKMLKFYHDRLVVRNGMFSALVAMLRQIISHSGGGCPISSRAIPPVLTDEIGPAKRTWHANCRD